MATTEITVQKPEEKQAVQVQPPKAQPRIGCIPTTFEEGWRFSQLIASSELAPKDYKDKPANVMVAIQMGAEVGLSPMAAIQNIAVINGRPSLWGDAALGIVQVHPAYVSHRETFEGSGDTKTAVFEITRRDSSPHITKFSVADAKKAQLWGKSGPWTNYPDRMLQMRARGFGLRDKFADALRGLSIAEEAMDIVQTIEVEARPALPTSLVPTRELTDEAPKSQPSPQASSAPESAATPPAQSLPEQHEDPLEQAKREQKKLDDRRAEEKTQPADMKQATKGLPLDFNR